MKTSFLKLKTMDLRYSNELNEGLITPATESTCKTMDYHKLHFIAVTARALTLGVKNDCKSMSVKLRYWIVNTMQSDTARPLVSRLYFEGHSRDQ